MASKAKAPKASDTPLHNPADTIGPNEEPARNYAAEFKKQRHLTKKEALKLKPGDVVELRWQDSPNTLAIVTEKMYRDESDVRLFLLDVTDMRREDYSLIVRKVGRLNPYGELIRV